MVGVVSAGVLLLFCEVGKKIVGAGNEMENVEVSAHSYRNDTRTKK